MIGPLMMAGLTDSSRQITANASDLAPHISDITSEGLVSLKMLNMHVNRPQHLHHVAAGVTVGPIQGSNAEKMSATFRMLQLGDRYQTPVVRSLTILAACCCFGVCNCRGVHYQNEYKDCSSQCWATAVVAAEAICNTSCTQLHAGVFVVCVLAPAPQATAGIPCCDLALK